MGRDLFFDLAWWIAIAGGIVLVGVFVVAIIGMIIHRDDPRLQSLEGPVREWGMDDDDHMTAMRSSDPTVFANGEHLPMSQALARGMTPGVDSRDI